MRPRVVITGLGAVSALGDDVAALTASVLAGRDGIAAMQRLDLAALDPIRLAGEVRIAPADARVWAVRAAQEAVASAGLDVRGRRVAVISGTTDGEAGDIGSIAEAVREALGASGPTLTVSTACSSSTTAIGLGRDLLWRDEADVVVCGGAERLLVEMFAGFSALGVLAAEPCAPFGDTVGTTLGEGAGYVVLEREGEREAPPRGYLLGHAIGSDAFHETSPEPRGEGVARVIAAALADAGLEASAIDYVNAHATGTAANDDAEWRGIKKALGAHAERIPVNGSKGLFGHAQGACGVLELIATLAALEVGRLPPSLRLGNGRRSGPPLLAPGPEAPRGTARTALAINAAFGGANAALVVSLDAPAAPDPIARRVVRIVGVGEASRDPGVEHAEHDVRQTDPAARLLLAATERALGDAGIRVRGALRERTGIFAGATAVSPTSVGELRGSIERGGLGRASAAAFARAVLHAPAGAVSRFLSLRGPATTLVAGSVSGVIALAEAAEHLAGRGDADVIVAAGWNEDASGDGAAAAVVLDARSGGGVSIVKSAMASTESEAIERALAGRGELPRVELSASGSAAYGSLRALIDVVARVRDERRSMMAVAVTGSLAVAIVLAPESNEGATRER